VQDKTIGHDQRLAQEILPEEVKLWRPDRDLRYLVGDLRAEDADAVAQQFVALVVRDQVDPRGERLHTGLGAQLFHVQLVVRPGPPPAARGTAPDEQ
jgi:hypothetical protein